MFKHYVLLAAKVLLRRKFFTFISLFGISFTLLVLMVVTAMFDHAFAPMAPESRQDLTLAVHNVVMYGPHSNWRSSGGYKLFNTYARNLPGVEHLSLYTGVRTAHSYIDGQKIESGLKRTDDEFWRILEFNFLEGGPYGTDDVAGARFVAVINQTTRRRFFGERPAIGQIIEADGQRFRVVGVVADVSEVRHVPFADIWVPYTTAKTDAYKSEILGDFHALALARDRASLKQIHDEFNSRLLRVELPKGATNIVAPFETSLQSVARLFPIADSKSPDSQVGRFVALVAALAALFALLPTVNLVNINVSRIMERVSEIGVRKAFGAPARTLIVQFLVENVLLTLVGGVIGLTLTMMVIHALNVSGILQYAQLTMNIRVFVYGVLIALLFGLISGVYPAWRMARLNPVDALKGGVSR
jgi:putative ABC transport system permease protein